MLIVTFDLDNQRYAIELGVVERVVPIVAISPLPQAPAVVLGAMNLHGLVVPVLDLRRRFGKQDRPYSLSAHLLIARTRRGIIALPVDEAVGVSEIDAPLAVRPNLILPEAGQIAGLVAVTDGLLFICDLEAFLTLDEEEELTAAVAELHL